MTVVRCYFEGGPDTDPADLAFLRVPNIGESVYHADSIWRVTNVTWTSHVPYLNLSYLAVAP